MSIRLIFLFLPIPLYFILIYLSYIITAKKNNTSIIQTLKIEYENSPKGFIMYFFIEIVFATIPLLNWIFILYLCITIFSNMDLDS